MDLKDFLLQGPEDDEFADLLEAIRAARGAAAADRDVDLRS